MKTFTINNVVYTVKPFTFNTVCDLEDMGATMETMSEKPMSAVRAYFAICAGKGKSYAGEQMEQHLINGGNFEELISVMSEAMNESDFFRNLTKKPTKKTSTASKKSE